MWAYRFIAHKRIPIHSLYEHTCAWIEGLQLYELACYVWAILGIQRHSKQFSGQYSDTIWLEFDTTIIRSHMILHEKYGYMIYGKMKWMIHVYESCLVVMSIHVYWLLYVFYMANMLVNMCLGIGPNWIGICYVYLSKLRLNGKLNSMFYEFTKLNCLLCVSFRVL